VSGDLLRETGRDSIGGDDDGAAETGRDSVDGNDDAGAAGAETAERRTKRSSKRRSTRARETIRTCFAGSPYAMSWTTDPNERCADTCETYDVLPEGRRALVTVVDRVTHARFAGVIPPIAPPASEGPWGFDVLASLGIADLGLDATPMSALATFASTPQRSTGSDAATAPGPSTASVTSAPQRSASSDTASPAGGPSTPQRSASGDGAWPAGGPSTPQMSASGDGTSPAGGSSTPQRSASGDGASPAGGPSTPQMSDRKSAV